jgi:hypothetical protein
VQSSFVRSKHGVIKSDLGGVVRMIARWRFRFRGEFRSRVDAQFRRLPEEIEIGDAEAFASRWSAGT